MSSLVTRSIALRTSSSTIESIAIEFFEGEIEFLQLFSCGCVPFTAIRTNLSHQALCQNSRNSRREKIGLYPHINQARNCRRGIIRVESTEYKMTGQSCLDGDLCCFCIANFSDHHTVGILT